jgi:hypothetical protein
MRLNGASKGAAWENWLSVRQAQTLLNAPYNRSSRDRMRGINVSCAHRQTSRQFMNG